MADKKMTKAEVLAVIAEAMADNADVVEYCENEIALLDKKKEKAHARAAAKKEAGNELRDLIETILENATEPMTREMVLGAIDGAEEAELTVSKVGSQISQLVQLGRVSKTSVKVGDKNKVAYVYGTVDAE